MLPSLQDIPGMLPGIFQRGEAATTEQPAGRGHGHGRQGHVDQGHRSHHSHRGHHGRDSLHLSPEARAVEDKLLENSDSVGDAVAAETDSKSPLGQAGGFVRQALETIRHDLGKALKAFGFDSDAIQNFTKAFVEPVLAALKEGVNFTAELSFAAFSQQTTVSAGGVSQSTSLVAQSLEIEVNQDTGEVSVSLAKLSFDQQVELRSGNAAPPLLVIDPDELDTPAELTQKILEGGAVPVEAPAPAKGEDEAAAPEGDEAVKPSGELEETLADVRKKLAEDAVDLQTRLTIYAVSYHKNDKGESITKLLLDAQLKITALNNDAAVQEEAESLDFVA